MKLIPAAAPAAWTCPMHAEVVSAEPGTCPECGMKLIAVAGRAAAASHEGAGEHGDHMHHAADSHHHAPEHSVEAHHQAADAHDHSAELSDDGLEWEDLMAEINARTDSTNMVWKLIDPDTGQVNHGIDWSFRVGDRVKVRLVNTMDSDHPMHHPFHVHGAGRFLVLARDEVRQANLVWKDTVLVRAGETVDILLHVTSPGLWMAHCHIAEHNQNGMMFSFRVAAA
jgi:FtsP/CotA-like multicopper oxidase with cupredoxin domain